MRFRLACALLLLAPAAHATPYGSMTDMTGLPPRAAELHRQGIALEMDGRAPPLAAIAVYEAGAREAVSSPIRAMFLYEEARLYVSRGSPEQIGVALDRLLAEPAHPPLLCDAPGPSASALYRNAGRYAAAMSLRGAQHEQQGRLLEAFREETAAHSLTPELRARVTTVHVDLDEPGRIVFDGVVFGPAESFDCIALGDKPRELFVNARSAVTNATAQGHATTRPGAEQHVQVSFHHPPAPAGDATGGGFLFLSAGVGGGYTNATAHGAGGDGRVEGRLWLLGDDGHTSLLVQQEGMFGGGSDGPLGTLRLQVEFGGRLPLHDEGETLHGLFLRGGLAGRALLDRGVQTGSLDLPVASAGYSFWNPDPAIVAMVGFRGGATLVGGYAVDPGSRHFEVSPTYGPFASLHVGPVHLDGQLARIDHGSPVDYAHGSFCYTFIFLGLCATVDATRAEVLANGVPRRTDAIIAGGTLDLTLDSTGSAYGLGALLKGR